MEKSASLTRSEVGRTFSPGASPAGGPESVPLPPAPRSSAAPGPPWSVEPPSALHPRPNYHGND